MRIEYYCDCGLHTHKCKCEHEFGDIKNVDWVKMPIKFCCKCNYYEFAYNENLQKNIDLLSGYE